MAITRRAPALLLLLAASLGAQQRPVRVLILTGQTDPSHKWQDTAPVLKSILSAGGRMEAETTENPRALDAAALARFDALVVHYNGPRFSPGAERAIEEFARGGKGLLSLHGVSYGPFFGLEQRDRRWQPTAEGPWRAWADLLGATWKPENIGHGARHAFTVKWVDREHPIARGLAPSFQADDELYHRLDLLPGTRVLAAAFSDPATRGTGDEEPIVWTTRYGAGRTVHITLGHDAKALSPPGVAAAVARAAEWAATGAVRER